MNRPTDLLLLPILAVQGAWVRWATPRLPPAAGPRSGEVPGQGETIGLWFLGESTVAGVGVDDHQRGLAAQTAVALARRQGHPVRWRALGLSGATAAMARERLAPRLASADRRGDHDAVVVCLGVNDVLRRTSLATWETEMTALAQEIRQRMGEIDLLFCGPPPLGEFPAFPVPLRGFLGRRAEGLRQSLALVVERTDRALLAPSLSSLAPHHFCQDRFHPGPEGYRAWGSLIADQLATRTVTDPAPTDHAPTDHDS